MPGGGPGHHNEKYAPLMARAQRQRSFIPGIGHRPQGRLGHAGYGRHNHGRKNDGRCQDTLSAAAEMLHQGHEHNQPEKTVYNGRNARHEINHLFERLPQQTRTEVYKKHGSKHSQRHPHDQGSRRHTEASHNHGKNSEHFAERLPAQPEQKIGQTYLEQRRSPAGEHENTDEGHRGNGRACRQHEYRVHYRFRNIFHAFFSFVR